MLTYRHPNERQLCLADERVHLELFDILRISVAGDTIMHTVELKRATT